MIAVDTVPKPTACPRCRSRFTRRTCLIRCCIDCGRWFLRGTR